MVKKKPHTNIKKFLDYVLAEARGIHPDWPKELVEIHATDAAIETLISEGYMNVIKR